MKDFILAFFGVVSQSITRFWERLRSGQSRQLAGESIGRVRSLFSSDEDSGWSRGRLFLFAAIAVILLVVVCVRLFLPSGPQKPARKQLVALTMRDSNKDVWTLQLVKGQSQWTPGDRDAGPPLLVKTDAEFRGGMITIGVHLEGKAGEKYVPGAMMNGKWQPAPKFQLVAENGTVLSEGQFEYG